MKIGQFNNMRFAFHEVPCNYCVSFQLCAFFWYHYPNWPTFPLSIGGHLAKTRPEM